jgi:hypothetical protein
MEQWSTHGCDLLPVRPHIPVVPPREKTKKTMKTLSVLVIMVVNVTARPHLVLLRQLGGNGQVLRGRQGASSKSESHSPRFGHR